MESGSGYGTDQRHSRTADYGSETKKNFRADQECNFPKGKQTKLICKSCYDGDRGTGIDDRNGTREKV